MPVANGVLQPTALKFAGGIDAVAAVGMKYDLAFANAFVVNDTIAITFTDSITAIVTTVGLGTVSGINPTFLFSYKNKLHALASTTLYFSAIADGTVWNDANGLGNGFIEMSSQFGSPEPLMALATFQSNLVVVGRQATQIWAIDADPDLNKQGQIFPNVGTLAPKSVMSVGDSDVYMLHDSGFRSIRVRDSSSQGIVADIGRPIDSLIQSHIKGISNNPLTGPYYYGCAVVEPDSNRYWCFVPNNSVGVDQGWIYVFTYYPESQIAAWSRYIPTFKTRDEIPVETRFKPVFMKLFKGRIIIQTGSKILLYGGQNNDSYDDCVATFQTPWMDAKTPSTFKQGTGIDAAIEGAWSVSAGMDPDSETLETVYVYNEPSYWQGQIPLEQGGTHMCIKGVTTGATAARFSNVTFHFEPGEAS